MVATFVLIQAKGHVRPYKGPYKVISRGPESFVLEVCGKQDKFLIHRLKPYFFQEDPQPSLLLVEADLHDHFNCNRKCSSNGLPRLLLLSTSRRIFQ